MSSTRPAPPLMLSVGDRTLRVTTYPHYCVFDVLRVRWYWKFAGGWSGSLRLFHGEHYAGHVDVP